MTTFIFNILISSGFQSTFLTNQIINDIKFKSYFPELDSNLSLKLDILDIFIYS